MQGTPLWIHLDLDNLTPKMALKTPNQYIESPNKMHRSSPRRDLFLLQPLHPWWQSLRRHHKPQANACIATIPSIIVCKSPNRVSSGVAIFAIFAAMLQTNPPHKENTGKNRCQIGKQPSDLTPKHAIQDLELVYWSPKGMHQPSPMAFQIFSRAPSSMMDEFTQGRHAWFIYCSLWAHF